MYTAYCKLFCAPLLVGAFWLMIYNIRLHQPKPSGWLTLLALLLFALFVIALEGLVSHVPKVWPISIKMVLAMIVTVGYVTYAIAGFANPENLALILAVLIFASQMILPDKTISLRF